MTAHPPTEHRAPITLVTAYFALDDKNAPRSDGRTSRDYHQWMTNFLPVIKWPLVIFCDEQSAGVIKRLRGDKPAVYHITRLEEFSVYRHRRMLRAHIAQRWPGFPADLSLIYHEKANFVRRAILDNPFGSEMFFWCDIGLIQHRKGQAPFRLLENTEWPNLHVCREKFADKAAFFGRHIAPARLWVWGTVWGGGGAPLRRFCDAYYRLLAERAGQFAELPAEGVMPEGQGFHTEEVLLAALANDRFADMRVFAQDDFRWNRLWHLGNWIDAILAGSTVTRLYLLSGDRFPWAHLGREISITNGARTALRRMRGKR